MVDAQLGKKYKLETSENFDEYMKAVGKYNFVSSHSYHLVIPLRVLSNNKVVNC